MKKILRCIYIFKKVSPYLQVTDGARKVKVHLFIFSRIKILYIFAIQIFRTLLKGKKITN